MITGSIKLMLAAAAIVSLDSVASDKVRPQNQRQQAVSHQRQMKHGETQQGAAHIETKRTSDRKEGNQRAGGYYGGGSGGGYYGGGGGGGGSDWDDKYSDTDDTFYG